MRLTTLLSVIVLTAFVLFLAGGFRPQSKSMVALPSAAAAAAPLDEAPTVNVAAPQLDPSAPSALPLVVVLDASDPQAVENRIAELETLALNDDAASLNLILVALADASPQIRDAALEATIQFDSPDAIPTLQQAKANAALPEEKARIQEAIDFLLLPPLATSAAKQP